MLDLSEILTSDVEKLLTLYKGLVVSGNKRHNLVARTNTKRIIDSLVHDSLLPLSWSKCQFASPLLDIGSGAGIPGIPLGIARDDLKITLLDSNRRKSVFLHHTAAALRLDCRVICDRAEQVANDPAYSHRFRTIVSRAVADLEQLSNWAHALLEPEGELIVWKGSRVDEEMTRVDPAYWSVPDIHREAGGLAIVRYVKTKA